MQIILDLYTIPIILSVHGCPWMQHVAPLHVVTMQDEGKASWNYWQRTSHLIPTYSSYMD